MKNVVAIWAANYESEEDLKSFVEISYDEDEEAQAQAQASGFMRSIGISGIDNDFMETHFINDDESRQSFSNYLYNEYCSNQSFSEQLPSNLGEYINRYNSFILLYANDSPYGSVNEFLLLMEAPVTPSGSSPVLLAYLIYHTN
ncbi:hypothetical protein BC351_26570 [Paenibacillus ferrarius]|uniref:Immunity protein 22 n=1 Tax=Paenibacillus ferrarius TaxID=1469647 RepID=A0A1V4HIZ8_9BACL|nr:immunity 22 family protein [Paenibacillus ferrarius]OPH56976.1 hypothetical protein BC351_26570 [Paenibacillus ferrarius]